MNRRTIRRGPATARLILLTALGIGTALAAAGCAGPHASAASAGYAVTADALHHATTPGDHQADPATTGTLVHPAAHHRHAGARSGHAGAKARHPRGAHHNRSRHHRKTAHAKGSHHKAAHARHGKTAQARPVHATPAAHGTRHHAVPGHRKTAHAAPVHAVSGHQKSANVAPVHATPAGRSTRSHAVSGHRKTAHGKGIRTVPARSGTAGAGAHRTGAHVTPVRPLVVTVPTLGGPVRPDSRFDAAGLPVVLRYRPMAPAAGTMAPMAG
ncbi:hypothetical protein [Actinocatenispora rupis]|uniref:Uncharacterized protein n=1 Tax=Actinocatenispora rupis TaxID=519421 RepID=A0A8J3J8L7_9ACTN|nr:hypothetical protein [Actinocatenispora rupis]GID10353.1 hypothetical protein Aru02nite_12420 [Actinocatenispora rupis]